METSTPASLDESVSLRRLFPPDIESVKHLAKHLFPIDYPDSWFTDIVNSQRFYTQAALLGDDMVAMLVAEVKPIAIVNKEDGDLLGCQFPPDTMVCYLLSLGVSQPFRRRGLARLLLSNLLSHLHATFGSQVKCIYLHVLATNRAAVEFYRGQGFRLHCRLPFYYVIGGRPADACSYALYLNGGRPRETCLRLAADAALHLLAAAACCCRCRRLARGLLRRAAAGGWSLSRSLPFSSPSSSPSSSSSSSLASSLLASLASIVGSGVHSASSTSSSAPSAASV